jgi:hypothetical protein
MWFRRASGGTVNSGLLKNVSAWMPMGASSSVEGSLNYTRQGNPGDPRDAFQKVLTYAYERS